MTSFGDLLPERCTLTFNQVYMAGLQTGEILARKNYDQLDDFVPVQRDWGLQVVCAIVCGDRNLHDATAQSEILPKGCPLEVPYTCGFNEGYSGAKYNHPKNLFWIRWTPEDHSYYGKNSGDHFLTDFFPTESEAWEAYTEWYSTFKNVTVIQGNRWNGVVCNCINIHTCKPQTAMENCYVHDYFL